MRCKPHQNMTLTASCMIRGPDDAVGVPKALSPRFCGTRQGEGAVPQSDLKPETWYWLLFTPVMFA